MRSIRTWKKEWVENKDRNVTDKDLLVFDEPTSGLDFDSMAQVAGLIRRLSEMGKVIFFLTKLPI